MCNHLATKRKAVIWLTLHYDDWLRKGEGFEEHKLKRTNKITLEFKLKFPTLNSERKLHRPNNCTLKFVNRVQNSYPHVCIPGASLCHTMLCHA